MFSIFYIYLYCCFLCVFFFGREYHHAAVFFLQYEVWQPSITVDLYFELVNNSFLVKASKLTNKYWPTLKF